MNKQIRENYKKLLAASDVVLNANLHLLAGGTNPKDLNICKGDEPAFDVIHRILAEVFDEEDLKNYNELVGRSPLSYGFVPPIRKSVAAILAILQ